MEKEKRKWTFSDVPLPGMTAPGSQAESHLPGGMDAAASPQAQPILPGESSHVERFQAQKAFSYAASSRTEQHEEIRIGYEKTSTVKTQAPAYSAPSQSGQAMDNDLPPSVLDRYDPPEKHEMPDAISTTSPASNSSAWLPQAGLVLVGVFVLIVSVVVLQEPLTHIVQGMADQRHKELIQAQRAAEYQALDADVRATVREIEKNMTNVDIQSRSLVAEAELRLGQPVQHLQSNPRERPREMDLAILESTETAAKWADVVNASSRQQKTDYVYVTVQDMNNRIRDGRLIPADRDLAAGLLTLTKQQEEQAATRTGHVRRLVDSLDAKRFELTLDSIEGSK